MIRIFSSIFLYICFFVTESNNRVSVNFNFCLIYLLFFLKLFLQWSPVAYWTPTNLGSSSFSVLSFCPFILFHGILKARIVTWFDIPSSSGPLFVRTLHDDLSVLHGMAHSFIELERLGYKSL